MNVPEFRSDVEFRDNGDIEGALTVSQISEKYFCPDALERDRYHCYYSDDNWLKRDFIRDENGKAIGRSIRFKPPYEISLKRTFFAEEIQIQRCFASEWHGTADADKKVLFECTWSDPYKDKNGYINTNIYFDQPKDFKSTYNFYLYTDYLYPSKGYSYVKKQNLYGEDGSLYYIQKRLENLENNFIVIDYERSTEGVDITSNNLIIDISKGKLILEKSNYEIQGTEVKDVVEILNDIKSRLEALGV